MSVSHPFGTECATYNYLGIVGRGASGIVFLLRRIEDDLLCVAKEMSIVCESAVSRAATEISVLHCVRHPNIVSLIEAFQWNSKLYIIMEYHESGDLHSFISNLRQDNVNLYRTRPQLISSWLAQLLLGIRKLHSNNIMHRDVKPGNIFLQGNRLVLGDFGLSEVVTEDSSTTQSRVGSPRFFPPEVILSRSFTPKSDVWCVGCVLYVMLTSRHPFGGGSYRELFDNVINGRFRPLQSDVAEEFLHVIKRTLCVNPADRAGVDDLLRLPFIYSAIPSDHPDLADLPPPAGNAADQSPTASSTMPASQGSLMEADSLAVDRLVESLLASEFSQDSFWSSSRFAPTSPS